ncbi:hypothetical protein [Clostridium sp. 1001271B_150615_H5]|jgi:hypothetical protein|uniref:hypothetical protein n=1 Tax=Clostridium sp. 1001271B_150615_H5 TaxID=2787105 RepID=UPI001487108E|nr:hypothetical protein [Clostridium sp. 1001271B_150615_H5]
MIESYNGKHFLETQGGEKPYGTGGNRDYEASDICFPIINVLMKRVLNRLGRLDVAT